MACGQIVKWLAVSILLYVQLDGFDLGVGILFGAVGDETKRHANVERVNDDRDNWFV
jgi:cytochrome bd ubiquinol oxidase subunit II